MACPVPPPGAGHTVKLRTEVQRGRRGGAPTGRRRRRARPRMGDIVSHFAGARSTACSSAANSVSNAAHVSGPFGCSTAARATSTPVDSRRQPPRFALEPGGEIWPPSEHIGAGSTAGNRSAIARARSRSSSQGSAAANRTRTWRPPVDVATSATYRAPRRSSSWPSSAAWRPPRRRHVHDVARHQRRQYGRPGRVKVDRQ